MRRLKLNVAYQKIIIELIKQYVPHAEVWAYGSRVRGRSHEGSDLDLVLRNPHNLDQPFKSFLALKQRFSESNLPIFIDLSDWANISDEFKAEIQKNYVCIYP